MERTPHKLEGRWFITGGAGYLARAIYQRAKDEDWNVTFTAFSRDDAKHAAITNRFTNVACIRGDVAGDRDYLFAAMAGHDGVIHAAASKYVDRSEMNVLDTVRNNIEGSRNVIEAAYRSNVEQVIGISTDKACGPVNSYGMTKAVMERMFWEAARREDAPDYKLVRYGNVIASTGSVIPLFLGMLAKGQPIPVTDPEMTRFYMTHGEAVDAVLAAACAASNGECLIPYSTRAMKLLDLVRVIVGGTENIVIAGNRPGEKQHEELISEFELPRAYLNAGIPYVSLGPPGTTAHEDSEPWKTSLRSDEAERIPPNEMKRLIEEALLV